MELLGVYFGSFDPLHENHVAVAKFALAHRYCSAVVLIANGDNPLKPDIAPCSLRQQLIDVRISQEDGSGGAAGAERVGYHQHGWWDHQDWWRYSSRIAQYRCNRREQAQMGWAERYWLCDKLSKQFGYSGGADSTIQLLGEDSFLQAVHNAGDSLKFARGRKLLIFPRTSSGATASSLQAATRGLSGVGDRSMAQQIFIASGYKDTFLTLSSTRIRATVSGEGALPGPAVAPVGLHPAVYAKLRELSMYGTAPPQIPVLYFTGRPGSGKSTTAWRLAEDLQLGYFSSGDVFRSLVAASGSHTSKGGGRSGKKKPITKEVATARVLQELETFLIENKKWGRGVVLDCQPREDADNHGEREVLLRTGLQINLLVNLVCTAAVAAQRISERGARAGEDSMTGQGSHKGKQLREQVQERANWEFEAPVQRLIAEAHRACPSAVLELDVNRDYLANYSNLRRRARAAVRAVVQEKKQKGFLPPDCPSRVEGQGAFAAPSIDPADLGQEVSLHYDLAARAYGDQKKSAEDASAKHFFYNNWVKSCLITLGLDAAAAAESRTRRDAAPKGDATPSRICVLDLGCGRGGDVVKWAASFLDVTSQEEHKSVEWSLHYLGLDLSVDAIAAARQRWSGLKKSGLLKGCPRPTVDKIHFDFQVADFTVFEDAQKAIEFWVHNQQLPSLNCFQLISSQMALHYSFESRARASNFVRICRAYACSETAGAMLLGTTVDSEVVRSCCDRPISGEQGSSGWVGNSLYRIEFLPPLPLAASSSFSPCDGGQPWHDEGDFGQAYRFSLTGAVDNCREFLVNPAVLEGLFQGRGDGPKSYPSTSSTGGSSPSHYAPKATVSAENFLAFGEQVLRGEADQWERSPTFQFFSNSNGSRLSRSFWSLAQSSNYQLLASGDNAAGPGGTIPPPVFDLDCDAREVCELYRILLVRFQGLRRPGGPCEEEEGACQRLHVDMSSASTLSPSFLNTTLREARKEGEGQCHRAAVPGGTANGSQPRGRTFFKAQDFSHIIVRHPVSGKYLAIEETWNRGWFIPAGCLDPGETYRDAAIRETLEETGVEIELKGILGIHRGLTSSTGTRRNVVFYAEPTQEWLDKQDRQQRGARGRDGEEGGAPLITEDADVTKSVADEHSLQARWMTCEEFAQQKHIRANDLLFWGEHLETGKPVYPLELLHECTLVKNGGGDYGEERLCDRAR